jgi:hypothetical protein
MMSGSSSRWCWILAVLAVPTVSVSAQEPPSPLSSESLKSAIAKVDTADTKPRGKLDAPLEAVAREWRRLGIKGAEKECASRNIPLKDLTLDAVINLTAANQRREVERTLRRSWGQVTAAPDETTLHVRLPVPAIRRMERLSAVHSIYLDTGVRPAGAKPAK